jgi:hypothetical protein
MLLKLKIKGSSINDNAASHPGEIEGGVRKAEMYLKGLFHDCVDTIDGRKSYVILTSVLQALRWFRPHLG